MTDTKKRKSGPSCKTTPYAERIARGQVALAVRLDSATTGLLRELLEPGESRQDAIRRLIWAEHRSRFT